MSDATFNFLLVTYRVASWSVERFDHRGAIKQLIVSSARRSSSIQRKLRGKELSLHIKSKTQHMVHGLVDRFWR